MRRSMIAWSATLALSLAGVVVSCNDGPTEPAPEQLDPTLVSAGRDIFRFDTFGDEKYWTDTLRMHEVIQAAVTPLAALSVGLKVDADALPAAVKDALAKGQVDLTSTATTITLLKLNAVVGLKGQVQTVNGRDTLMRVGVTCALCHSTVDNSLAPGIGKRLDGWPNGDLNPGAIVALSPAVSPAVKTILKTWGAGMYDPRINIDGLSTPIVIPPAYGLLGVDKETYTAEGPVSYWNAYVAVTQMHGQGTFADPRIGVSVVQSPDLVTPKLPALRAYQLSIAAPKPAAGSYDSVAAERGRSVFNGAAQCASCHVGAAFTDVNVGKLHAPGETGMDGRYAARTATKAYRTTPLRGLALHAPYFHDGSARTLTDVVEHYNRVRNLALTDQQQRDLVEYLKTL
jgi:mono/diheme cytochrome c family protein